MGASAGRGGAPDDKASQARRQAAAAFCSALWGLPGGQPGTVTARDELSDLYVSIFTTPGNECEWVRLDEPWKVADRIVALDDRAQGAGRGDVYIGATLTGSRESLPRDNRGRLRDRPHATDARALIGVWADLDIASLGEHTSTKAYPPTEDAVRGVLARLAIAPSLLLHTGHGLQAWWLLSEPWVFGTDYDATGADQDADREAAAALSRDWVHTVRMAAEDAGGWAVDSVFDLARLMRPAGTTNRKGAPARVSIIEQGRTYELDDIREALADEAVLARYRTPSVGPEELGGIDLFRCWARATSLASRERDYTPPWVEVMNENVDEGALHDAWTVGYSREDPSTVDARLTRFLFDAGASTEQVCEALMCLHLRTDHKVDKVDPHRRTDYLITTVGKFRATSEAAKAKRDGLRSTVDRAAAHAAGQRVGEGAQAPEPRQLPGDEPGEPPAPAGPRGAAPSAPDPAAPRAPGEPAATGETTGAAAGHAVQAPQPHGATSTAARADEVTPDDGADGATRGNNEPEAGEDTPEGASQLGTDTTRANETPGPLGTPEPAEPAEPAAGPAHDELTQHVLDRVRHPVDEVGGWGREESPRATPPPPIGPSATDPFGKRDEIEAQLLDELTNLLINHQYVAEGCLIWRIEYRNQGAKQEGRLLLRMPQAFAWPVGRPPLYRPGRPLATSWLPMQEFDNHKGFHTAIKRDVRIIVRDVAPKGAEVQAHQADPSSWRAIIDALVPYWHQDSSGTDMAAAVHDWLLALLTERPAMPDNDEAISSGRPWLADAGSWSPDNPPRILIPRSVLLDFIAAQPGSPGPGPATASLLDLLHLHPRRLQQAGSRARRARWLEVDAAQFDHEQWAAIIADTAEALLAREHQAQVRKGLRLVADGEHDQSATETMRARLAEHGVTVREDAAVGDTPTDG